MFNKFDALIHAESSIRQLQITHCLQVCTKKITNVDHRLEQKGSLNHCKAINFVKHTRK